MPDSTSRRSTFTEALAGLLTPAAAALYEQLLHSPLLIASEAPERAELIDRGLARVLASTGELHALPPEAALTRAVYRAAADWLRRAPDFDGVIGAIESLDVPTTVAINTELSTAVDKQRAVDGLLTTARRSVWSLQPYPEWIPEAELDNEEMWSPNTEHPGVKYRFVYDERLMRFPSFHAVALREAASGVSIRLANWDLPTFVLIADRSTAIYFPQRQGAGTVTADGPMVSLIELAFEAAWDRSVPLRVDSELEPGHLQVHTLLIAGHTTRQIASLLGLNERTVRRRITDLMDHYGQTSKVGLIRIGQASLGDQ